jgi:hypothetical protein
MSECEEGSDQQPGIEPAPGPNPLDRNTLGHGRLDEVTFHGYASLFWQDPDVE